MNLQLPFVTLKSLITEFTYPKHLYTTYLLINIHRLGQKLNICYFKNNLSSKTFVTMVTVEFKHKQAFEM